MTEHETGPRGPGAAAAGPPPRRAVRVVDTSTRDGNQSLWGATGLTTGMVEALGPVLDRAGFHAIDFTSSTHLAVGVRWHREDPWERVARMRAVVRDTPLSMITTGMRFMSWDRAPEALIRLSMRVLARHGLRRVQIAEPMNDTAAAARVARIAKEEGFEQVVAAVTFTESPVHTDDLFGAAARALAAEPAVDAIYLKDPGGLLTPERAAALLPPLRAAVGALPLELHSHGTTGLAAQVYVVAARLGVDVLHTALGALANGTSQPSLTRLVENLAAVGIDVDVDLDALAEAEEIIARIAEEQGLAPGVPVEYDLRPHAHQVPGGMMGTLRRQLAELGLPDALPAVLEETALVRAELGYPVMVTPYSQFVGSQAVLNVVAARAGQPRWSRLPDEVIRYVLGQFGTPPGPVADVVREAVAASPRTRELDVPPDEPTVEQLRGKIAAALGRPAAVVSDEEVVLRSVLPADAVAAVAAAGPAPAWRFDGRGPSATPVTSAAEFARASLAVPGWRSLTVTIGDERISLRRGEPS
ncbi:MAG: biotin carboxyl carrier protein [Frankia sp.]|nr:biotin carboxyl carrier protein [Frankia sp.]